MFRGLPRPYMNWASSMRSTISLRSPEPSPTHSITLGLLSWWANRALWGRRERGKKGGREGGWDLRRRGVTLTTKQPCNMCHGTCLTSETFNTHTHTHTIEVYIWRLKTMTQTTSSAVPENAKHLPTLSLPHFLLLCHTT